MSQLLPEAWIVKGVQQALENEAITITEEEITKAQQRIATRMRERTIHIATVMFKEMSFERFGNDLRITLKMPEGKQ